MRCLSWFVALALSSTIWTPAASALHATSAPAARLEELLREALAGNPNILAARKRLEAAQARIPLAKGLPAPRIGIEFEEIPRGSIKLNQATLMYQLIQSLPFPGKLSARHQVAVKEAQQAAMTFKQAEWDVVSQVKAVYYDLFLIDRERELREEELVWLMQAVGVAQARYATGAVEQADVLRLQAEELEAANELAVLDQRRQAMNAHLNHLLNRPAHHETGHPGAVRLAPLTFSPEELFLIAMERQPELLAFRFSAERGEAAWKLAKRELLPDLETMVELRDPAIGPFGPWDLTLAMALPFWFWTKWRYGVKVALYDRDSAAAAYQSMSNEIQKRVHEHWHEAQAAYLTARLCQDGLIHLSDQAVGSAMAAYQGGRGSFMNLLDALNALSERKRTYYQHLVAYEQHVAMLEEAAGIALRPAHEVPSTGGAP